MKTTKASEGFTAEEREAMKERAREAKSASSRADGERDLLAKIAEMPEPDRSLAERVHAIVMASAPDLAPKTWYGMPAYAKDGKAASSSASSRPPRSSRCATRRSVSSPTRSLTMARCGRRPSP